MDHTPADIPAKIAELKRELSFRDAVYPGLIKSGKLERSRANRQVFVLKCILHDYTGDELSRAPVVHWDCPVCSGRNHSPASQQVVECRKNERAPDNCGGGPFLLLQTRTNRALAAKVGYTVHKIDGIDYPSVQRGLAL